MCNARTLLFQGEDFVLRLLHPSIPGLEQIVVPETLRPRLLHFAHHSKRAGLPERTRMFSYLRRSYYWPLMAAYIASKVRSCPHCALNLLHLIRRKQPVRFFPLKQPLEYVSVKLLGPLPRTKAGNRFILMMADRFTKPPQVVQMKRTTCLDVTKTFSTHYVFKHGGPKEVLSDKGPQFARNLYQNTCRIFGISNTFISAYHLYTNGQVDSLNRSIAAILRCYVSDHP